MGNKIPFLDNKTSILKKSTPPSVYLLELLFPPIPRKDPYPYPFTKNRK